MEGRGLVKLNNIKQPKDGFIPVSCFKVKALGDSALLGKDNLPKELVAHAVDHLTNYMLYKDVSLAFKSSLKGFVLKNAIGNLIEDGAKDAVHINTILSKVDGLSEEAIIAACKASLYDFWVSDPKEMLLNRDIPIEPDKETIYNISTMVNRCLRFEKSLKAGKKTKEGLEEGYLLGKDAFWIISSLDEEPDISLSLKLLIYYADCINERKATLEAIKTLGIFNPRLNRVYRLPVKRIDREIFEAARIDARRWREER